MAKLSKKQGFATRQIRSHRIDIPGIRPISPPIFPTTSFIFDSCEDGAERFQKEDGGYIYSRLRNPNSDQVGRKVADLENAEDGLALSSGMAAISTCLLSLLQQGDEILADICLYGTTYTLMRDALPRYGIKMTQVDFSDVTALEQAIRPETKLVYFETPANPNLRILDIEAVVRRARKVKHSVTIMVDNTFSTPYLQRPIDWGVDVVVHSGTKYLSGHGDVISGFICGKRELIRQCRDFGQKMITGSILSPFDAFLVNRGLKTLDIRMKKHSENAQKVAEFLESHPKVRKVYYPGLESFEGYAIAKKQMLLPGGMIAFELEASKAETERFVNSLELCTLAVSLGDVDTLIEHPASMTHVGMNQKELAEAMISESLLRLSVGLEDVEDIIDDLKKHLEAL